MPSQSGNPPDGNLNWSDLDVPQIIQRAFEESTDRIRVDAEVTIGSVILDASTSSIAIGDQSSGHLMNVNADGSINVDINNASPIPVTPAGLTVLGSFNIPYTSISHTSPYTITAGFGSPVRAILLADTMGQTEKISYGAGFFFTSPGCEHQIDALIPASTAITIQSQETSNPVAGNYVISFLG